MCKKKWYVTVNDSWPVWVVFHSLFVLGITFLLVALLPVLTPIVIDNKPQMVIDTWFYVTVVIASYAFVGAVREHKKVLEKEEHDSRSKVAEALIQWQKTSLDSSVLIRSTNESNRLKFINELIPTELKSHTNKFYTFNSCLDVYVFETEELMKKHNLILREVSYEYARNLVQFKNYDVVYISTTGDKK